MSHGDSMHCNHQCDIPVGEKKAWQPNYPNVLVNNAYAPSSYSMLTLYISTAITNDSPSKCAPGQQLLQLLLQLQMSPDEAHNKVLAPKALPQMCCGQCHARLYTCDAQCTSVSCGASYTESQPDYPSIHKQEAVSKVAFGHHILKIWIVSTQAC